MGVMEARETPHQSRGLTEEESETWHALAGLMVRLPSALDTRLQQDSGISHVEYLVMSMLSQSEERTLRMSDLARHVGSSLSRLSHLVKRLERSGWVRREPDPSDGRYTLAVLTEAGHAKVVDSTPGHADALRHLVFDALTRTQQRQLRDIGRRVWRSVAPDDHCVPPPG
ncbi:MULTISPECIES: MarR family winged helix-turn-helix transcriptional regulator [Streptomyces]|nr:MULTISPECIES: MarR family transcriptional regulator [Streptomyces]KND40425.1 MarR family transcriptional regulator [Streptomyces stelliscabiei]MDX2517113.1 MarR family transcriptional regulator [Streptomyces stelliscabiei]MDX2554955.1 MarR family transcriptional regulator [Streptomyces stelliscabiei]MDX2611182.1 MarR family transcriptional regulator [Streptomyces stelliscabiei]MDX2638933.1 MarR family transcriptional regulator [Streptomyces stelliscabiei]